MVAPWESHHANVYDKGLSHWLIQWLFTPSPLHAFKPPHNYGVTWKPAMVALNKEMRISKYIQTVQLNINGAIKKYNGRSVSNKPQIARDLDSAVVYFWSRFGNSNFNWWWVMTWRSSKLCNCYLQGQFDHERQDQSHHETIYLLTNVFYTSYPNLLILAYLSDDFFADRLVIDAHRQR